jgi:hypothetical protein
MTVAASANRRSTAVATATHNLRRVHLPGVGEVTLPPPERVAYYAGVGTLAAFGLIDWPVALVITAGHLLADQNMFARIRGLGEAAESA